MAREVYIKQIASYNTFLEIAGHIHHHSRITTGNCLPYCISFNSGYFENDGSEIK
jgi:hypothetical protein